MLLNAWNGKQVAASLHISESKVSRALALLELPEDVQSRIQSGELSPTAGYELSKLRGEAAQRALASEGAAHELTQQRAAKAVRQRRGKSMPKPRRMCQTFFAENGIKVTVSIGRKVSYLDVEQALEEALDEVRTRIDNNIQLY